MNIYLSSFLIGLVGLSLSLLTVIKSLTRKAKLANVIFDWKLFLKSDLLLQLAGSLLTVFLGLLLLNPFFQQFPQYAGKVFAVNLIFATIGYMGADIASRLFSVVNSRINSAIDYKTTISDQTTGNLDSPTPAAKPIKETVQL